MVFTKGKLYPALPSDLLPDSFILLYPGSSKLHVYATLRYRPTTTFTDYTRISLNSNREHSRGIACL